MQHVPDGCTSILSIGCGAGRTEQELVKTGVKVTGIEMDSKAVKIARERGIDVLEGDATEICASIDHSNFDCVVFADVLEHIINPEKVVKSATDKLRPGGSIIVSVPNFRYYKFIYDIVVRGGIEYQDAGIYDRTHIRITTARMVEQWLRKSDLVPQTRNYNLGGRRHRWISIATGHILRCFLSFQVIVVGTKPPKNTQ